MVDYRTLVADASTGTHLAELPLSGLTFSRVLTGVGTLTGSLPIDHVTATEANLKGDREITVMRDDEPVWNGPLTGLDASRLGSVTITAREASWYLSKRTLEVDKHYNKDTHQIVRSLDHYMENKTSTDGDGTASVGSNINAALPRYAVSTGDSGVTKELSLSGTARHTIAEILEFLVEDPDTGLEYRMDYTTGSTRQAVRRTLTLGSPLGVTVTQQLTEAVLYDYARTMDWERGGTRVHVVGGRGITKTKQNTASITAGTLLLESVFDRSDTSSATILNHMAREARRRSQPPVQTFTAVFVPGALAFDFCNLGDKVPFDIRTPNILSITADNRRVVQIDVTPPSGETPELVALTFNLPLDELGE